MFISIAKWIKEKYYRRVLVTDQRDEQILFYVFISTYNSLHVSNTQCSSSGETNCTNTASGNSHSTLVAKMCAGWKKTDLNKAVLVQFVSPDDERCVLKTCREL
jgi:hypothetical protein